jgi:hypothetical protein
MLHYNGIIIFSIHRRVEWNTWWALGRIFVSLGSWIYLFLYHPLTVMWWICNDAWHNAGCKYSAAPCARPYASPFSEIVAPAPLRPQKTCVRWHFTTVDFPISSIWVCDLIKGAFLCTWTSTSFPTHIDYRSLPTSYSLKFLVYSLIFSAGNAFKFLKLLSFRCFRIANDEKLIWCSNKIE